VARKAEVCRKLSRFLSRDRWCALRNFAAVAARASSSDALLARARAIAALRSAMACSRAASASAASRRASASAASRRASASAAARLAAC